ncbi:MAG TPA: putative LPS assembly protein LptD [Vicinamibacterales bacterium]|nr:putative LPS assembly protein LptD [Vicinamibacterales bacterium]
MLRWIFTTVVVFAAVAIAAADAAAQDNPLGSCRRETRVQREGLTVEKIEGRPDANRFILTGSVAIICDDTSLFADEVIYETDTKKIFAKGSVTFRQLDLQIFADRADLDGATKLGTFFNAAGSTRLGDMPQQRSAFGTQEADVMFRGETIARTGPQTYKITNGGFTTCVQPTPRWEMSGTNASITLDERVVMKNVVLRVKNVPLAYLPIIYYPINKEDRSTGFLLPSWGSTTYQGFRLSNAFFWAIDRSQDATFFHDYFSKTGMGYGGEYRYAAAPGSTGSGQAYVVSEKDQYADDGVTLTQAAHKAYKLFGNTSHALPHGFRFLANVNYFSDIATQQIYEQNLTSFSNRERSFGATVTGGLGRYRFSGTYDQRDIFQGVDAATRSGRTPAVNIGVGEKALGRSRVYLGGNGEVIYLVRQDDLYDPLTNRSLWRFDGKPEVRAPLSKLPYLTLTTAASWRLTHWGESIDLATGEQVPVAITRQLLEMRADMIGPIFARIWQPNGDYAERVKHLIEPAFSIVRTSPFRRYDEVVKNDYGVDTLVGGVTTLRYGLTNRILVRKPSPAPLPGAAPNPNAPPGAIRDILSIGITQSWYTDALAAAVDPEFQSNLNGSSTGASQFSPVQIQVVNRPTDVVTSTFRMEIDAKEKEIRTVSASSTVGSRTLLVTAGYSKQFVIAGLPGFDDPRNATHYINAATTIRDRANRLSGTYEFNYDILRRDWLQQRFITSYNTQCCGVSFDYQQRNTAFGVSPTIHSWAIAVTLAGIGSFSNSFGSFAGR